jgi:hypothetical protein
MSREEVCGEPDGREAHPYYSALLLSGVNHEHLHLRTLKFVPVAVGDR